MAAAAVSGLVTVLESYRGRDRVIRTLCYSCQLLGGVMSNKSKTEHNWGKSLLIVSSQLSHCRTVLRLFDDLAMLAYSVKYGFGKKVTEKFNEAKKIQGKKFKGGASQKPWGNKISDKIRGFMYHQLPL